MALPMSLRPLSYFWVCFLRQWRSDVGATFLTPVLYLASMGLGLGAFIGHGHSLPALGGENYVSYVAPALLATTAMQVAMVRATYEVFGCVNRWSGAYRSMQAAPLSTGDIVTGHLVWVAWRVLLASVFYLAASAAFGAVHSPAAVGDLLIGPLIGLAFAAPLVAYSITVRHDQPFTMIFRLLMLPLFLFSGTFFPLSELPAALRSLAYALPLWHGVELSRALYRGQLAFLPTFEHLVYLVGLTGVGVVAARAAYRRRLAR